MSIEDDLRRIVREELVSALAELRTTSSSSPASADALLTVEQVAERAGGVSAETVRHWINTKQLRARRAGHRWVVRPLDLEQFLSRDGDDADEPEREQHLQLVAKRITKAGSRR